jgi:nitrogen fixation-related uncharacterized protein
MSSLMWLAGGGIVVVAVGVWTFLHVGQDRDDMGTISGQWIAEHRSQERQSDNH